MLQVLVADADMLMHPLAETWAELVHLIQEKGSYSYIVAASNSFGKMCYHELQLILMFHLLLISLEYLNHESLSGLLFYLYSVTCSNSPNQYC